MESKFSIVPITALLLLSSPTYADPAIEYKNDKRSQTVTAQGVIKNTGDLVTNYEGTLQPASKILTQFEIDEQKSWSRLWD